MTYLRFYFKAFWSISCSCTCRRWSLFATFFPWWISACITLGRRKTPSLLWWTDTTSRQFPLMFQITDSAIKLCWSWQATNCSKTDPKMCLDPAAAVLKSLWQQLPSLLGEAADHLNEEERQQPPVVRKYLSKPFLKRITVHLNYCSHWETLPEGKSATSFIFRLRADSEQRYWIMSESTVCALQFGLRDNSVLSFIPVQLNQNECHHTVVHLFSCRMNEKLNLTQAQDPKILHRVKHYMAKSMRTTS